MKVLVVTNVYPQPDQPAFGTFVRDQVEALRHTGIEVDVLRWTRRSVEQLPPQPKEPP